MAITKATTLANFASGITGIGSVGIGTTDPRLDLEINGDARLSDNSPRIEFHDLNAVANTNCTGGFEVYDQNGSRGIFVGATEGANQINFGVSGVERARVTQQGIGIGTTGSSHPLTVNEGSSGNKFLLLQKNSGQTLFTINEDGDNHIILNAAHASGELKVETNSIERLHIDSSGNIGIGTDSVGNISNRSQVVIGGVTGGLLDFNVGGDTEGRLFATDATGLTIRASQSDGNIIFQTGGSDERLRITGIGSVGIGQNDPDTLLHLTKTNADPYNTPVTLLKLHNGGGNQGSTSRLEFKTGAATCYIENYIGGANSGSGADLVFATPSSGTVGTERMRIHSDGYVTKPNQPSFFSRPAGNYNLSSGGNTIGGTWSDVHDIGSHFSNGTFTAPVAGTYQFSWSVFVQSETTRIDAYILVNGTNVMREEIQGYSSTGYNKNASVHGSYYLSANDAVTFGLHSTAGTNIYVAAQPWSYIKTLTPDIDLRLFCTF